MNNIAQVIRYFIYRDLIFILSGSTIIVSTFYFYEKLELISRGLSIVFLFYFIGFSYIIGYVVQDIFGLLKINPVRAYLKAPPSIVKRLYRWFEGEDWLHPNVEDEDIKNIQIEMYNAGEEWDRSKAFLERILVLKQISTAMFPSFLISSLIIGLHAITTKSNMDFILSMLFLFLSFLLLILGWIKSAQETDYILRFRKKLLEAKEKLK